MGFSPIIKKSARGSSASDGAFSRADKARHILVVPVSTSKHRPGESYNGMFPCFLGGSVSRLF